MFEPPPASRLPAPRSLANSRKSLNRMVKYEVENIGLAKCQLPNLVGAKVLPELKVDEESKVAEAPLSPQEGFASGGGTALGGRPKSEDLGASSREEGSAAA